MAETPEFVMALDDISASILALENQIALKAEQLGKLKTSVFFIEMEAQRIGAFSDYARNAEQREATKNGFLLDHEVYQDRLVEVARLNRSIAELKAQKRFEERSYELLMNSEN